MTNLTFQVNHLNYAINRWTAQVMYVAVYFFFVELISLAAWANLTSKYYHATKLGPFAVFWVKYRTQLFLKYTVFGKREVWVRSASVIPKGNNVLMSLCYIWVRSASVIPKRNNGLMTHCYIWVRLSSVVPKCNSGSLIHCYVIGYNWYDWYRSYQS